MKTITVWVVGTLVSRAPHPHRSTELKMKYFKQIYPFLGIIFILSFILTVSLPVDKFFKGLASTPAIAALIGALYQLFRDQAEFEKKKYLQQQEQIFNLGTTSHMANIAFDKHVEFCEKYMKEVDHTVSTLFAHGPSKKIDSHLGKLIEIRREYAAWISNEIAIQLDPFEKALNEVGALSGLSDSLGKEDQQARKNAIKKMYRLFCEILNLEKDPEIVEKSEIAIEIVKSKVRSILGVEELTKLRKILINRALTFIENTAQQHN